VGRLRPMAESGVHSPLKVAVVGAAGKMGQTALRCLSADPSTELVLAVGRREETILGVEITTDLAAGLDRTKPDVLLELTSAASAPEHVALATQRGIPVVVGSTGVPFETLAKLSSDAVPVWSVPNFAIGAVLMMRFAEMAAEWLPDVEIIETHHERKLDAPSGTAMVTAQRIAKARTAARTVPPTQTFKAEGARGGVVEDVPVHSVRLPGFLAHQEVVFGGVGEGLTIRHDSFDRRSFEAGILLAVTSIHRLKGFQVGLDLVLF